MPSVVEDKIFDRSLMTLTEGRDIQLRAFWKYLIEKKKRFIRSQHVYGTM